MTLLPALANASWRRCLLNIKIQSQTWVSGTLSVTLADKAKVRVLFVLSKTGWPVSPVLMTEMGL